MIHVTLRKEKRFGRADRFPAVRGETLNTYLIGYNVIEGLLLSGDPGRRSTKQACSDDPMDGG